MTSLWRIAATLSVLTAVALGESVLEWGDSEFETVISQHETALVMFYAPWLVFRQFLMLETMYAAVLFFYLLYSVMFQVWSLQAAKAGV